MTESKDQRKLWEPLQLYDDCIELRAYIFVDDLLMNEQQKLDRELKIKAIMRNPFRDLGNMQQDQSQRDSRDQARAKRRDSELAKR